MTLETLRRKVKPATVEVDSAGCVEIIAPDGYCYEHTLHALITDPEMMDRDRRGNIPSRSKVLEEAYHDFCANVPGPPNVFQKCADTCSCKES